MASDIERLNEGHDEVKAAEKEEDCGPLALGPTTSAALAQGERKKLAENH